MTVLLIILFYVTCLFCKIKCGNDWVHNINYYSFCHNRTKRFGIFPIICRK